MIRINSHYICSRLLQYYLSEMKFFYFAIFIMECNGSRNFLTNKFILLNSELRKNKNKKGVIINLNEKDSRK